MKWMLLLPFYRQAYVGLIANAYAHEMGFEEQEDHSTYEVMIFAAEAGSLLLWWFCRTIYVGLIVAVVFILRAIIRFSTNLVLFQYHCKHPVFTALCSAMPGVLLYQASKMEKQL